MLIVLNDDTVVCKDCYEPQRPFEIDPGLVPFGETIHGECKYCGATAEPR